MWVLVRVSVCVYACMCNNANVSCNNNYYMQETFALVHMLTHNIVINIGITTHKY